MSYSESVLSLRGELLSCFLAYLATARGIHNLEDEDDIGDLHSYLDGIIEDSVEQFKQD
jgi:hypothetical protein